MKTFTLPCLLPWVITAGVVAGCQQGSDQPPPASAPLTPPAPTTPAERANDFPTLARVEYVMQCMLEHGGQNYDNLYHCVCAADTVANQLSYEEFAQAQTFTYLYNTPGERGGEFRDPPQSSQLRTRLKEAKALAQKDCFPPQPEGAAANKPPAPPMTGKSNRK